MSRLKPRDYQQAAIDAVKRDFIRGLYAVIIHLFTGAGKTLVSWELIEQLFPPLEGHRTIFVGGINRELVFQAKRSCENHLSYLQSPIEVGGKLRPGIGLVMGNMNNVDARVIMASVQTLVDKSDALKKGAPEALPISKSDIDIEFFKKTGNVRLSQTSLRSFLVSPRFDQILLNGGPLAVWIHDEAHHAPADGSLTMFYRIDQLHEALGIPLMKRVGNTATPIRVDGKAMSNCFQKISYSKTYQWGQRNGYLVEFADPLHVTVSAQHKIGDDIVELGDEYDLQAVDNWAEMLVKAWVEKGENRPTIAFVDALGNVGAIEASKILAAAFNAAGIPAAHVDGAGCVDEHGKEWPTSERFNIFQRFQRGQIKVIVNYRVMIEGIDLPLTSCILLAQEVNPVMLTQILGRGMRLFAGDPKWNLPPKENLLVLEATGQKMVAQAVGTMMGFKVNPFSEKFEKDIDLEALCVDFANAWAESREDVDFWAENQDKYKETTVMSAFSKALESKFELLGKAEIYCLEAVLEWLADEDRLIGGGKDLRDVNEEGYVQGKGTTYKIASIVAKSDAAWFGDNQTALLSLAIRKGESLLIHPPYYGLAEKARILADMVAGAMTGETQNMFSQLNAQQQQQYYEVFSYAKDLFSRFTLWLVNSSNVDKPFLEKKGYIKASEYLDVLEAEAVQYASDALDADDESDIFMAKGKNWRYELATDNQLFRLNKLGVPEDESRFLKKGEAAKLITHLVSCNPVLQVVNEFQNRLKKFNV